MEFQDAVLSFPVVVYTTLLGVVLVYWMLALIGLVNFEHGGPDLDLDIGADVDVDMDVDADIDAGGDVSHHHLDGEPGGVGSLASYLVALGLGGVPFSVVVSLLTLFSWVICCTAVLLVLPFVPTDILRLAVGAVLLLASFALAIPLSAGCVRPMRKLFVTHNAVSNASLVGQECIVLTTSVNEKFGRAEIPARGAGYYIRVVADMPNNLKKGDIAIVVEYDETAELYRIAGKEKF